eukprot:TRINITY_DN24449_c0_g1_i1.p1 TRINITY_DN24449_c0_g1~~TRINITY_DN24449_c0_g1_i1.p1  ORF type:complete len:452 (-),score=109.30 TRINITY_DN24449_c0_g1_i1:140-1495(-)
MIRRPPRSTLSSSSAASDVYKRQVSTQSTGRTTQANMQIDGDVVCTIYYRGHNGTRQSDRDPETNKLLQPVKVTVQDARRLESPPTLEGMGFGLIPHPTGMAKEDFYDDNLVKSMYYPLCEDLIKKETGAAAVRCFHHAVRGKGRKPFAGAAHCDYSVKTAFDLVSRLGAGPELDMAGFKGRVCVMNVWRNINPDASLLNHHLAMCDGASVVSPDDFVYYDVHDEDGTKSETYQMDPHNHGRHRWYYFPEQRADEALVFMQYDSDPTRKCRYTFHTSLTVSNGYRDFPRESVEVRLLAFFPQEENSMPDMTLPAELRIPAAVDSILSDLSYLPTWDDAGRRWVAGLAAAGDIAGVVKTLCENHRREGLRGEFKDLTDEEVREVTRICVQGGLVTEQISKHLAMEVPATLDPVLAAANALRGDFEHLDQWDAGGREWVRTCLLYTSPSPRDS